MIWARSGSKRPIAPINREALRAIGKPLLAPLTPRGAWLDEVLAREVAELVGLNLLG